MSNPLLLRELVPFLLSSPTVPSPTRQRHAAAEIILGKNNRRTAMNKERLIGFEAEVPQLRGLAM
jgi:hypothetical protein